MRSEFVVDMAKAGSDASDRKSQNSFNTENGRRSIVFVKNEADSSRLSQIKYATEADVAKDDGEDEDDNEVELIVAEDNDESSISVRTSVDSLRRLNKTPTILVEDL